MRKLFYPLTLLAIIFAAVLLTTSTSCSKDDDEKQDDSTTTGGTDDVGTVVKASAKTNGDTITISGTGTGEIEVDMQAKPYMVTFKINKEFDYSRIEVYSEDFSKYSLLMGSNPGAIKNSWYESSDFWAYRSDPSKEKIKITTTSKYEVILRPLPLKTASAKLPVTYTTAGFQIVGPLSLSGNVSFECVCKDAKKAGVSFELYSEDDAKLYLDDNFDFPLFISNLTEDNKSLINDFSKTVNVTGLKEGRYFVVVNSNSAATCSVTIK